MPSLGNFLSEVAHVKARRWDYVRKRRLELRESIMSEFRNLLYSSNLRSSK